MISVDSNLLLYSFSTASPHHRAARAFLEKISTREDVALSEFVLAGFYLLLRNPAVLERPLGAAEAAEVIAAYRQHPLWQTVGFPPRSRELHDRLWAMAASRNFARRRIYDARIALSLLAFGVNQFATLNVKDFKDFGFNKVWNPLTK
ncbi:MAG: VapC toxin family PIN domain ribonuclease [Verrucomicrobia bacterium]|nr:VapC toxin family PIN domain ribonuclease [Verrucomicrobiota bacterium]